MKLDDKDIKKINIRLPKDIWAFLKKTAIDRDCSMNVLIIKLIKELKNNKKLLDK